MEIQGKEDSATSTKTHHFPNFLIHVVSRISFSFVNPLLAQGASGSITETSAFDVNPIKRSIQASTAVFTEIYNKLKLHDASIKSTGRNLVMHALVRQYAFTLMLQLVFATMVMGARFLGPFSLRWFLTWLDDFKNDSVKHSEGWIWAIPVCFYPFLLMLVDHQSFWLGYKLAYKTKMSMMAAIHEKLLKLNSSAVAKISTGHVVNLASNDVNRFEDACVFWFYLIFAPIETILVLICVTSVLGFLPAISGLGCIIILGPLQGLLSKYIAKYRVKTARVTDKRISFISEFISGILAVKMLGWEDPLLKEVKNIRNKEHNLLKKMNYIVANTFALSGYIQTIMVCATFIVYRFTGDEFHIPDIFFAISLFSLPRVWMAIFFPLGAQNTSELFVSTRRLDTFFRLSEIENFYETNNMKSEKGQIIVKGGNYGWYAIDSDDKNKKKEKTNSVKKLIQKVRNKQEKAEPIVPELIQTLTNIEFEVKPGELIGIVGKVGSGKSSLLSALLNDMENLNPDHFIQLSGSVSYSAQVPWIMAATVQENIIFKETFDEELYNQVVSSCALDVDFKQFPYGDQTIIGERGINLSGGQKARISLARSAYSRADVHLLDDPLSAVDPKVGQILFDRCISGANGLMKNSTRLLATHQKQFLPFCDRIILMNNGHIECIGTWNELANHELLKTIEKNTSVKNVSLDDLPVNSTENQATSCPKNQSDGGPSENDNTASDDKDKRNQLLETEGKESGQVGWRVYWNFTVHVGVVPMMLTLLLLTMSKVLYFAAEWWVAQWAATDINDQQDHKWIWVLLGISLSVAISSSIAVFSLFHLLIVGSTNLHNQMTKRVLHSPLRFFHRNPSGRILNRFSRDTGTQDDDLPWVASNTVQEVLQVIGTFVLVSIALPYVIPSFLVIAFLFAKIRRRYITTSREVKRFDAITRSPVYAMLSSNIKGLCTIRSFGKQKSFQEMFLRALELNGSWWIAFFSISRWVGLRMDGVSAAITVVSTLMSVAMANHVSAEILGLALMYVIGLSGNLQWCMRQTAELENLMTAVERTLEYTKLEQEPPTEAEGGGSAPEGWPKEGSIEYTSLAASYRPGLDPVLHHLEFFIPGGSSVGIVGRTGSGKSSLLLTLFRLIDIIDGKILIDGVDTSSVGIDVLRKQLAVIPQDPVLFGGTIRSNLDPWSEFSDSRIWSILNQVHMSTAVNNIGGIDAPIAECGTSLSVGQRQLLCLARALLTESSVLALDEATANVDRSTDALIQDSLHEMISRKEKTLLIIAHRVHTVLDCDLILVLDKGRMIEFGSPTSLLDKTEGVFRSMVNAAVQTQGTSRGN
eukprot:g7740.t1